MVAGRDDGGDVPRLLALPRKPRRACDTKTGSTSQQLDRALSFLGIPAEEVVCGRRAEA